MKVEMAKFLQETIKETSLKKKKTSGEPSVVEEFSNFVEKVSRVFYH